MADDSKEDFIQLVKRIGAYLSVKVSNILNTQDIRSVWAIAGFAVAVIFTYRLIVPRRSQPKNQAHASSSNSGVNNSQPNANLSSSQNSSTQNVIDESPQPIKPILGQIVKQRLSDGRKVTCRLLGVILEENTPEELQKEATMRCGVLDVLLEMTKLCDLYLMETILDDESEKNVLMALENAGLFISGGLVKDKVLFCSTDIGRTSFVRQLEPDWHIDSSPEITTHLARFIKYQLHISDVKSERIASNVFNVSSLEQFFSV